MFLDQGAWRRPQVRVTLVEPMGLAEQARSLDEIVGRARSGDEIRLPPGTYFGPVEISRGITLRGAGDLTRVSLAPGRRGSVIRVRSSEPVHLQDLLLEGGRSERGGALDIAHGRVRLFNVQLRRCSAREAGGGIYLGAGQLDAERVRALDLDAGRGGAVYAGPGARLVLRDAEIRRVEAQWGGALALSSADVTFEGVTIGRCRALSPRGGQFAWLDGGRLSLVRVRLEGTPLAPAVINRGEPPGRVEIEDGDLPRAFRDVPGVIERGASHWR